MVFKNIIILIFSLVLFACPPNGPVKEYYEAAVPQVKVTGTLYTMECLGSSKCTSCDITEQKFIDDVLKKKAYVSVDTAHAAHDTNAGFTYSVSLAKLTAKHQHGRQTIPFKVKDSTGVYTLSSIDIFVTHDTTPPVVAVPSDIGIVKYGTGVTNSFLIEKLFSNTNFSVTLNPCAKSVSQKYEFIDWDYPTNFEENTEYNVKFKIKDSLNNLSEEKSFKFTYGENLTGAPKIEQLQDITFTCFTVSPAAIESKIQDSAYIKITLKPGNSLSGNIEILTDLSGIQPNIHYHNNNLQVQIKVKDNENLVSEKSIKVVVNKGDPTKPNVTNQPVLMTLLKSDRPFDTTKLQQIFNAFVKEYKLFDIVKSACSTGDVTFNFVGTNLDVTQVGTYDLNYTISDTTGDISDPLVCKIKVIKDSTLPDNIPATVTVESKQLFLTHYDAFMDLNTLQTNWDIGNPGHGYDGSGKGRDYTKYREDSGNPGIPEPVLVEFPDGIKGYSGDRYKQPYWSPKAVAINASGQLEIQVFWDPDVDNPLGYIPGSISGITKGYGLSGAIHSKRQFPCGLFVTKIRHKTGKRACHWDAWWAESNNPFSRKYGSKELFMPPGGATRERRGKVFFDQLLPNVADRCLNGEQLYEFDMYEWVSNDNTQWQVLHAWDWYGGYPGNEDRDDGGDIQLWSTSDGLRGDDKVGMTGMFGKTYLDGGQASSGNWFYLIMLVTPDKIIMWNSPIGATLEDAFTNYKSRSNINKAVGAFGNNAVNNIWPADEYAPIQVKYSIEIGQWSNNHKMIYDLRATVTKANPDVMYSEYFAFYAWDTTSGKYPKID